MLHMLDARCKFFIISCISISVLSANIIDSLFYFLILLFLFKNAGIKLSWLLKEMKYFFLLLIIVFAARAFIVKGEPLFSFYDITITKQGLQEGFSVAFNFFLVMLTGLLFSCTTKTSLVKSAVQWFLKPIPFIPEKRVSIMIALAICFIPVILKQAREISDARKARCGNLEKNPVKKIVFFVLPLLKKIFLSADNLVLAMESRSYSDDRTEPEFNPSGKEVFFLGASLALSFFLACF